MQSVCYTYIRKDILEGHLWRDFFEGHVWILGKNILHYCFVIQHLRCFPLLFMSLLLFFQSEQWQKLLANKLLVIFAITVTPTNTEMLMSILWTKYFNTLMVKLCTQLSKTLRTGPGLTAMEIVEKILLKTFFMVQKTFAFFMIISLIPSWVCTSDQFLWTRMVHARYIEVIRVKSDHSWRS